MQDEIRNEKGQFVAGHTNNIVKGPRDPHPIYPWLDTKGRPLPGKKIPGKKAYQEHLKKAMIEEISAKDIKGVIRELHSLCIAPDISDNTRIKAMELFFNRLVGHPSHDVVHINDKPKTQNVQINFSHLPTEDLRTIETILEKNQPLLEGDV